MLANKTKPLQCILELMTFTTMNIRSWIMLGMTVNARLERLGTLSHAMHAAHAVRIEVITRGLVCVNFRKPKRIDQL